MFNKSCFCVLVLSICAFTFTGCGQNEPVKSPDTSKLDTGPLTAPAAGGAATGTAGKKGAGGGQPVSSSPGAAPD